MKKIMLFTLIFLSISNYCLSQKHTFKISAGLGLKKNILYDYDKDLLKSNSFKAFTKINLFPDIIIDYSISEKIDFEFSLSIYSNAYWVKQKLSYGNNTIDFQYGIKTTTGNFCLGVKYSKNKHSFICGINLDYNSLTSNTTSTTYYAADTIDYEYNFEAPWVNYFSQGIFIAYKIGLSKKLSAEIKYSQDFYRLPVSDISTSFTINNLTTNYSGHVHPLYGYVGLILIYH